MHPGLREGRETEGETSPSSRHGAEEAPLVHHGVPFTLVLGVPSLYSDTIASGVAVSLRHRCPGVDSIFQYKLFHVKHPLSMQRGSRCTTRDICFAAFSPCSVSRETIAAGAWALVYVSRETKPRATGIRPMFHVKQQPNPSGNHLMFHVKHGCQPPPSSAGIALNRQKTYSSP